MLNSYLIFSIKITQRKLREKNITRNKLLKNYGLREKIVTKQFYFNDKHKICFLTKTIEFK